MVPNATFDTYTPPTKLNAPAATTPDFNGVRYAAVDANDAVVANDAEIAFEAVPCSEPVNDVACKLPVIKSEPVIV